MSESWFYKWRRRPTTPRQRRRAEIDAKVRLAFDGSGGTYGSPRVLAELRAGGERVSKKTVEASMARQDLVARPLRRRYSLTRPDRTVPPFPDLVRRDFHAEAINQKWSGDLTEIPTLEGKLYLAAVEDLASRRVIGFAVGEHHDTLLASSALNMAVAVRGGDVAGVIFHTDRGSEYTSGAFGELCQRHQITQSMGRVGSALDNACSESFFSTLEFELLSRQVLTTKSQARKAVANWIDGFYNRTRRHTHCGMLSPTEYEQALATSQVHAA
ncbi:MAG TPA: IS3 family transposase [Acidimicrobiales bacterium]|nr:IS3 family transposase [Acidimicrobiales bacterium]